MADKVLSLDLVYKGKFLTYARSNKDFDGQRFFIGSDRSIFWQILDTAFPKRHLFVTKEGSNFVFHLTKGMSIAFKKGEQSLSVEELRSKNMLKNDRLVVDESSSGSIMFLNDWRIDFTFRKPFIPVMTAEDIANKKQFGRYAALDPMSKGIVTAIIVAVLLTCVVVAVVDYRYAYLGALNPNEYNLVRSVTADIPTTQLPELGGDSGPAPAAIPETGTGDEQGDSDKGSEGYGPANAPVSARGTFGSTAGRGASGGGSVFAAMQQSRIGGGQGAGLVGGGSGGGYSKTAVYDAFGSGSGGSGGAGGPGSFGDIYSGASLGGGGIREINPGAIAGRVGSGGVSRVYTDSDFQSVRRGYGGARHVVQGADKYKKSAGTSDTGSVGAQLDSFVNAYKNRLMKIFANARFQSNIYGSIQFTILISNSRVEQVQCAAMGNSNFNEQVINQFKSEIKTWKIPVTEKTIYDFNVVFSQ
jgi:hypothetical protein